MTEMTILTVQLIVEFSKHLPGFQTLCRDDQVATAYLLNTKSDDKFPTIYNLSNNSNSCVHGLFFGFRYFL